MVGRVLDRHGRALPWWRVVLAGGRLLEDRESAAAAADEREGTPLRDGGGVPRVDVDRARTRL
jgi:alkylated DNA nucleotide flippase Atl1